MTKDQINIEMLYHICLAPFKDLLIDGVISNEDYKKIDTILRQKYNPIFVDISFHNGLDICPK
jgi:hypothetical protein